MKNLAYVASLSVLATGIAFAQTSGSATQGDTSNSSGNSSSQTSQSHKAVPKKTGGESSDPSWTGTSIAPATSPTTESSVPNATIHDQPGSSSRPGVNAGQKRSGSMGTTGRTPETSPPDNSPSQKPKSSTTPDSPPPPHTSLVNPTRLKSNVSGSQAMAGLARKPPHAPDAGTQPLLEAADSDETQSVGEPPMPR